MIDDPTELREKILSKAKFNLAGLPGPLRDPDNQKVYLDAVIQAVSLLGHGVDEDDSILWVGSAAGMLLLDGHFDPRDQRFFQQVQRAMRLTVRSWILQRRKLESRFMKCWVLPNRPR